MLPALLARPRHDDLAGRAAGLLAGWDGRMAMDLPQPMIFAAWVRRFEALALAHRGLPQTASRPWVDFTAWLLGPDGAAWCDGDCRPLLDQALAEAMPPLAAHWGADPAAWRWGDVHLATFADPVLPQLTNRIPQPGDDTTIFVGAGTSNLAAVQGPSYRGVYDLADLDRSRFIAAPGQSGNPLSPHFRDLLERWRDGGGVFLPAVAEGGDATLTLRPAESPQ